MEEKIRENYPPLQPLLQPLLITEELHCENHHHHETNGNESPPFNSSKHTCTTSLEVEEERIARICATYLNDYHHSRKTILYSDSDYVSFAQLKLYYFRNSFIWQTLFSLATLSLFLSSVVEGNEIHPIKSRKTIILIVLTAFSISVYLIDMLMATLYRVPSELQVNCTHRTILPVNPTMQFIRHRKWAPALVLYFLILGLDTGLYVSRTMDGYKTIWSGAFKPVILFYYSSKSRDAVKALKPNISMVIQVVSLELFFVFFFAVMGFQLYGEGSTVYFNSFQDLWHSFISMFELSTTVVNPGLWMEIYAKEKSAAIFFVSFMILLAFYCHSLVLTVLFKSYMQSIASIQKKKVIKKEIVLGITFRTMNKMTRCCDEERKIPVNTISTKILRKTLEYYKPHYRKNKIRALLQIVDYQNNGYIDYDTFRAKIPLALRRSVRSRVYPNKLSVAIDIFAVVIAVANLVYVISFSLSRNRLTTEKTALILGTTITCLATLDVFVRINPFHIISYVNVGRFDKTFDMLAFAAAIFSIYALTKQENRIRFLIIGRSIDMVRVIRFSRRFREIVHKGANALWYVIGPLMLLIFATHFYCYVGMLLWGGKIHVGTIPDIEPFYDLNNFNSYLEGLLTMFNILIVNDWYQIAKVYEYISEEWIVYTFFISALIICVVILLNVFLSFFIGAFVAAKFEHAAEKSSLELGRITTGLDNNTRIRRVTSRLDFYDSDSDVSDSVRSDEFNVIEREDFDDVMRRVTGEGDDETCSVKDIVHFIDVFENLIGGQEKVGYLVCHTKTLNQYGNHRFHEMTDVFLTEEILQTMISEVCQQIVHCHQSKDIDFEKVDRIFEHPGQPGISLEISASLLRPDSSIALFVSRIKRLSQNHGNK